MKKVTAFVGSARKKHTYNAVAQFLNNLQSMGDIEYEYGGGKIVNYLDFVGHGLGFNTVKGCCITTLEPMTEKQQQKIDGALAKQARRYYAGLEKSDYPVPTLIDLMFFRMSRTKMRHMLDDGFRDYTYYTDKGWFESDFYYPTRLGPLKKGAGKLFDAMFAGMTRVR